MDISGFKGADATLSARKAVNQFVKIAFIYPLLLGYPPLVKSFILETNREESKSIYGDAVCYLDKKPYKSLIASHIKPCVDCLKEHKENEAYDVDNGLLLSPTVDSYFDKKDISFDDDGIILIGANVADAIRIDFEQ